MKYITLKLFVLFVLYLLVSCKYPEGSTEKGILHEGCPRNCEFCLDSATCLKCNKDYFELNGSCFANCIYPRYPFSESPHKLECRVIESLEINSSQTILEDYNTKNGATSRFLHSVLDVHENFELSLWVNFENLGPIGAENNFLIISELLKPYQYLMDYPYVVKLTVKDDKLRGPTELNDIKADLKVNTWFFIVINHEKIRGHESYDVSITIFDFDDERERVQAKIENYFTSYYLKTDSVFHVGNLNNASNFSFNAKKICLIFYRTGLGNYGGFLSTNDFYILINPLKSEFLAEKFKEDGFVMIESMIPDHLSTKMIFFEFSLETFVSSCPIFKIFADDDDNELIFSLEIVIKEENLFAMSNDRLDHFNILKHSLKIILLNYEGQLVLLEKNKIKIFNNITKIKVKIFSSFENCLLNDLTFIISDSPQISKNLYYRNDTKSTSLQNMIEEEKYSFFRPKPCNDNPKLDYYIKKDDCILEKRNICLDSIPHCKICFNETYCLICQNNTYFHEGNCLSDCSKRWTENYPNFPNTICSDCSSSKYFLDENENCRSCNIELFKCVESKPEEYCFDYISAKNCIMISLGKRDFCQENCLACQFKFGQEICHICESVPLYNISCVSSCPKGHFALNNKCVESFYCDESLSILQNDMCYDYTFVEGYLKHKRSSIFCQKNQIYQNDTCFNLTEINYCIQGGPRWCEFCLKDKKIEGCGFYHQYQEYTCGDGYVLNFFYTILPRIYYDCPHFSERDNPNFPQECISAFQRRFDYKTLFPNAKISNKILINNTIKKIYFNRSCPEYLEGFYIIHINHTCLFVPNTHHIFLDYLPRLHSSIKVKSNMRIKAMILSSNELLQGTISHEILHVKHCPQNFIANLSGYCIFCGHSCQRCQDLDESCLSQNNSDVYIYESIQNYPLFNQIIYIFNPEDKVIPLKIGYTEQMECPPTCKSCYYTGSDVFCSLCTNNMMEFYDQKNCKCKNELFFDHLSKECVEFCPPDTYLFIHECLRTCNHMSSTFKDSFSVLSMSQFRQNCLQVCPVTMYSFKSLDFHIGNMCFENIFYDKLSMVLKLKVYTEENFIDITRALWRSGLIQLSSFKNFDEISSLVKFLQKIENFSEKGLSFILDTFSYLQLYTLDKKSLDIILDTTRKILLQTQNFKCLAKSMYMMQVASRNIKDYHQNPIKKYQKTLDADNYFFYEVVPGLSLRIERQIKNFMTLDLVEIIQEFNVSLSFLIRTEDSEYTDKLEAVFKFSESSTQNIFFGNHTSTSLHRIAASKRQKIYSNCIYFIFFRKEISNETFDPMIDEDLYYGNVQSLDDIWAEPNTNEHNIGYHYLNIVMVVLLVILSLYFFFSFLKNKIMKPAKVKFIQMAEVDSDEEDKWTIEDD